LKQTALPAMTTRGMREPEMALIGDLIARVLAAPDEDRTLGVVKSEVERLCRKFPLYPDRQA
jgi:glycine hydroxymethyltransferase